MSVLGDVNFAEKTVTFRSETAKSGKSAVLPLNKTALETLQGVKHEGGYIFISPRSDTRLNNVSKGWLGLMKRAKIENFRFHDWHLRKQKARWICWTKKNNPLESEGVKGWNG